MKIVVLGEGAWGSAIASVLAYNNNHVNLWCYHKDIVQQIATEAKNERYCSYYTYHRLIRPTNCINQALKDATIVFNALPMQYTRTALSSAAINDTSWWIALNKGLECTTTMLPTQLLYDLTQSNNIGALMGPSFARQVINQEHTFVNSAATTPLITNALQQLLTTPYFHIQPIEDLHGMQWCAVLKNCIALGMGVLQGAGVADNLQAAFMSKVLNQVYNFLKNNGADSSTLNSLAGIGDIVLTCYGQLSKNNKIGRLIGAGNSLHNALQITGYIPEAVNTLRALEQSDIYNEIPLLKAIHQSLNNSNHLLLIDAVIID